MFGRKFVTHTGGADTEGQILSEDEEFTGGLFTQKDLHGLIVYDSPRISILRLQDPHHCKAILCLPFLCAKRVLTITDVYEAYGGTQRKSEGSAILGTQSSSDYGPHHADICMTARGNCARGFRAEKPLGVQLDSTSYANIWISQLPRELSITQRHITRTL